MLFVVQLEEIGAVEDARSINYAVRYSLCSERSVLRACPRPGTHHLLPRDRPKRYFNLTISLFALFFSFSFPSQHTIISLQPRDPPVKLLIASILRSFIHRPYPLLHPQTPISTSIIKMRASNLLVGLTAISGVAMAWVPYVNTVVESSTVTVINCGPEVSSCAGRTTRSVL